MYPKCNDRLTAKWPDFLDLTYDPNIILKDNMVPLSTEIGQAFLAHRYYFSL